METHTSLELSKKLAENGCKLKSEIMIYDKHDSSGYVKVGDEKSVYPVFSIFPAYDILNDICVKYAKEFFGDDNLLCNFCGKPVTSREKVVDWCTCSSKYTRPVWEYEYYPSKILTLLQDGKKQEAEDYIWEHCLFNPKNHE